MKSKVERHIPSPHRFVMKAKKYVGRGKGEWLYGKIKFLTQGGMAFSCEKLKCTLACSPDISAGMMQGMATGMELSPQRSSS